LKHTKG